MGVIADTIRRLAAKGFTVEQIADVVEVYETLAARTRQPVERLFEDQAAYVYALIDLRTDETFYIGITNDPGHRLKQHRYDPASAAWLRIGEIEDAGAECKLEILAKFENRYDACRREQELICSLPNLVNRDRRRYFDDYN